MITASNGGEPVDIFVHFLPDPQNLDLPEYSVSLLQPLVSEGRLTEEDVSAAVEMVNEGRGDLPHRLRTAFKSLARPVQQLLATLITIPCAEAVAETIGSVMEDYHNNRYTANGGNDSRSQKEMFCRLNGPPQGV